MASSDSSWLSLSGRRRLPVIRQSTIAECGLACMAMIVAYFGRSEDLVSLRRRFGMSLSGAGLASLARIGDALHLSPRAVRCRLSELRRLTTPCILHWEFDHFVVLKKVTRQQVLIHDPASGAQRVPLAEADGKFTGVALEFSPTGRFERRKAPRRLRLGDLVVLERGHALSIPVALLFAVISELLLLVTPFYLQTVIDQVLTRGDHLLLHALVIGFAVLAIFRLAASAMRQLTFQFLSHVTVFSLSSRVIRHLLHLPVSWFRERTTGDIQQRMQSLTGIQAFVTQALPSLVLDSIFLLIVVVMMTAYAPLLSMIVVATAVIYTLWRVLVYPAMLEQTGQLVRAEAAAQSHLLESLRSIQSIRMCAGESSRTTEWQNLLVRRINTQIRAGNLGVVDGSVHQALFQGLHIGIVFLLARHVQRGEMSIGEISAFVAYTGMFVTRASGIVNRLFEYKLLRVPLERLADVVFNEAEEPERDTCSRARLGGNVRASGLRFSYPGMTSVVLDGVSLDVTQGELLAICGGSGSGKSTLLRILAGIEQAASGLLCFDGKPLAHWPPAVVRRSMATVFHDDALVSGSIAKNIALFDPAPDHARVQRAAELAAVAGSIEALPMRYETPIGDLGSALSAGQVQRLLFARALYRRPSLMLLDEFTSGLDEESERRVLQTLQRLRITRIVVTHSPHVLRACDRVYRLSDGKLTRL